MRPRTPVPSESGVVAVDVGGTTLKGAAFHSDGSVLARLAVPTFSVGSGAEDGLRWLIRDLIRRLRSLDLRIEAIAVSSPGLVDSVSGTVRRAVNLGWSEVPLKQRLEHEFDLPVLLEHDARAGALGERAARDDGGALVEDFAFIPIGTGVACAAITSGGLIRGAGGAAGEFGHIPVVPNGRRCACGQRGCVEAYASANSIVRRYRSLGGTARSMTEIAARLAGDAIARQAWAEAMDALATGIIGITAILDPAAIVIGGGVAGAGAALLDPLRTQLAARLTWRLPPLVLGSVLGTRASLIGIGLHGWGAVESAHGFALTARSGLEAPDNRPAAAHG